MYLFKAAKHKVTCIGLLQMCLLKSWYTLGHYRYGIYCHRFQDFILRNKFNSCCHYTTAV